jgi:hypothetical protein
MASTIDMHEILIPGMTILLTKLRGPSLTITTNISLDRKRAMVKMMRMVRMVAKMLEGLLNRKR